MLKGIDPLLSPELLTVIAGWAMAMNWPLLMQTFLLPHWLIDWSA